MSTTTDATASARLRPPGRRGLATLAVGTGAVAGWLLILLAVTLLAEPHPDVLVPGPPRHTLALLHGTDIRVTDLQDHYAVLHGTRPGFVRTLYAQGAYAVLPARAPGCFGVMRKPG
jgi:hypothetical protein